MRKHRKLWLILGSITLVLLVLLVVILSYLNTSYAPDEYALKNLASSEIVEVKETEDLIIFEPISYETGLIFYPGGKVQAQAYAPLMQKLAMKNVLGIIVKMPFNLAVFNVNGADGLQKIYPKLDDWYIGGHSLGGAMAASYVLKHEKDFKGLLLLAAYSSVDLSATNLNVISIYGSDDLVLNLDKYEKNRKYLPKSYNEYIISGGIHSFFGSYGIQSGDGKAKLSKEEQLNLTVSYFLQKK